MFGSRLVQAYDEIMDWKEVVKDPEERKVFMALDGPNDTWRTIGGIARQTGLSEEQVMKILQAELALDMGMAGTGKVSEIDRSYVRTVRQ